MRPPSCFVAVRRPPAMAPRRLLRFVHSRPRLIGSAVLGLATGTLVPASLVASPVARGLVGWNVFALVYLALALHMMLQARPEHIIRNAVRQDDGRRTMLALVVAASVAVLAGIGTQLADVRDLHGAARGGHVALAALTVASSWGFTQASFALHYAHDFFAARCRGEPDGLQFPGTPDPSYDDFLYFACVIGTSAQTADVSFTSSAMRRVGLVHAVQAFFFNTTVLALAINIAAGLF